MLDPVNAVAAARSAYRLCVPTAAVKHDEVAADFVKKCDVLAHARMPCASVNMHKAASQCVKCRRKIDAGRRNNLQIFLPMAERQ